MQGSSQLWKNWSTTAWCQWLMEIRTLALRAGLEDLVFWSGVCSESFSCGRMTGSRHSWCWDRRRRCGWLCGTHCSGCDAAKPSKVFSHCWESIWVISKWQAWAVASNKLVCERFGRGFDDEWGVSFGLAGVCLRHLDHGMGSPNRRQRGQIWLERNETRCLRWQSVSETL